jgi:hypothetical protein
VFYKKISPVITSLNGETTQNVPTTLLTDGVFDVRGIWVCKNINRSKFISFLLNYDQNLGIE